MSGRHYKVFVSAMSDLSSEVLLLKILDDAFASDKVHDFESQ